MSVVVLKSEHDLTGTDNSDSEIRLDVTFYETLQDFIGGVSALSAVGGNCRNFDNQLPTVSNLQGIASD